MSFEVRGGPRLFQLAINALDVSGGSNTAIERDLFAPLRQFVLAGEDTGRYQFNGLFWFLQKGGRQYIFTQLAVHTTRYVFPSYTRYVLPSRGLYHPYHPLQEPEESIDQFENLPICLGQHGLSCRFGLAVVFFCL